MVLTKIPTDLFIKIVPLRRTMTWIGANGSNHNVCFISVIVTQLAVAQ
jgi:hypothetical protein